MHWNSWTCLLQPRELYPGFREVFGYLLMSSGEGGIRLLGSQTLTFISLASFHCGDDTWQLYFKKFGFWPNSKRIRTSVGTSEASGRRVPKSCNQDSSTLCISGLRCISFYGDEQTTFPMHKNCARSIRGSQQCKLSVIE